MLGTVKRKNALHADDWLAEERRHRSPSLGALARVVVGAYWVQCSSALASFVPSRRSDVCAVRNQLLPVAAAAAASLFAFWNAPHGSQPGEPGTHLQSGPHVHSVHGHECCASCFLLQNT